MVLVVTGEDRLKGFLGPKFRRTDLFQTGSVPISSRARQRLAGPRRLRNSNDVGCFRVDIQRGRIFLHRGDDLSGVRWRPTGAAVAATIRILFQLPERNVAVSVSVSALRISSKTDVPQQCSGMSADLAPSGVRGVAFAVKLNERAYEDRVLVRGGAVIAFEGGFRLSGYVGPAGHQERVQRIAEVLRAPLSVAKIRDTLEIAAATVTRRKRTKRPAGFADDVKSPSHFAIAQIVGTGGVHC